MKLLSFVCACFLLAACGNRGALYLPEKRSTEVPAASTDNTTENPTARTATDPSGQSTEPAGESAENTQKKNLPPVKE